MFRISKEDSKSKARLGVLETPHGIIETPAYAIVGTHAEVKCLNAAELEATKTQLVISNTYHLWRALGDEGLAAYQGIHEAMNWQHPIMTDSGGFQVFSFGAAREFGVGKIGGSDETIAVPEENRVRVTESGVYFWDEGEEHYLDAELSIRIQEQIGADIMIAFDEPTSPLHDYTYNQDALRRTHAWAKRCLEAKTTDQLLYGVVQGGAFEDLRRESSAFIGQLPFDGFAIGGAFGTSFGSNKKELGEELAWSIAGLPKDKPRHLLGIGRVEDLFAGVEAGIDTFDCVIPTREARHGSLWTNAGRIDIKKSMYQTDDGPLDDLCGCPACLSGINRAELRTLFKNKDQRAGNLATMHNVWFFNTLMEEIREAIKKGTFKELKQQKLAKKSEE